MNVTLELELDVECDVVPADPGSPQTMHGPGDPSCPAQAKLCSVKFRGIDITRTFKRREIAHIEAEALEEMDNRAEAAREAAAEARFEDMRDRKAEGA